MKTFEPPHSNPFPGLRPFRSDEHHLFFGREEQTAALLQLLRTNRFLAVVGTSGSGKSSLVRSGMIAALHGGTMTHAGSSWEVMILRPGGSPIENLARAFVDSDLYDGPDPSTLPRLLATLNRSRFGLVEAMKQSEQFGPGTNLLVVVDQFEELFRFRQQGVDSEEAATAFVNLLLTASEQAECPVYVTITMRSDYLGDCCEIPGLAEAVNEGEYLIPRLLRDQKRDAIEKPIGVGGAKISPLLVQRLLNEVGDDPDQLPVLQHALMRMWGVWSAGEDHDRPIDIADFEATGGLASALSNHADEIYDSLPDERHRSACEKIFKALTEKGADNRGIRRPTRLAQLGAIADCDRDTVKTVLDAFRGSGVTFVMPGIEVGLDDRTVLDLSHESLMRGWQRLRGWVEDEAQSARIFRRVLDTARLWGEGKASLFHDPDLQIALSWREKERPNAQWAQEYGGDFETAMGFLDRSSAATEAERQAKEAARRRELEQARELAEAQQLRLEQQKRSAGRLRKMLAGLAVVAVVAGLACVAALVANRRANTLAENARQNAQRAEQSQKDTADALTVVESQKAKSEAAERIARDAEEAGRKLLYTTDMRLVPFVWRDDRTTVEQLRVMLAKHIPGGNVAATTQAISAAKPDLRGFEWHYYQHLLNAGSAIFSGHGAAVVDGAFSVDGQLLTLDQIGQLRRWDPASQDEQEASRRDLPGGAGSQVREMSPDGRLVAVIEGSKVRVLDSSTGKELSRIDSANRSPRRLIFSREADRLVIVDDKIHWCNAVSGEVIASFNWNTSRIESLAVSADGLTLAVVGHNSFGNQFSTFRLDAVTKTATALAKDINLGGSLAACALSTDGKRLVVGGQLNGFVYVLDAGTGRFVTGHASAHASPITSIAVSGDGGKLATADIEGTIKIWADPQKLTRKSAALLTLKGHQGRINSVRFSIDGKRLASVSGDRTARVWDLENAGVAVRPLEYVYGGRTARFSPDGQWIACTGGNTAALWDGATGRLVRELSGRDKGVVSSVAFSPDGRLLAVGHGGQADVSYVALWDIDSGKELADLDGATDLPGFRTDENTGMVGSLAFSPDGKHLVAGFGSKFLLNSSGTPTALKVWDVASRRLIRRLDGHTGFCISLDFSRDGTLLASGSRDGTAIIWSTATWRPIKTLANSDRGEGRSNQLQYRMVEDVAFSPNGKTLAMGTRGGNLHLWDVATGELVDTLKGHSNAVSAVAFSPDGRTLASGGADQTLRLWNAETRRELMQLDPGSNEPGAALSLEFSADGRHLLAGGSRAALWSSAPVVWSEPDRAAEKLRLLLQSGADFKTRVRMLSENLRLHEALAKLGSKDARVQAALAAAQANWHASRRAWPEAVQAFDRLLAAEPRGPEGWLRTPGLLRLATALLDQNRPAAAARLLQGGASRRAQDGALVAIDRVGLGLAYAVEDGEIRITEMLFGFGGSRAGLAPGDIILKVNDTDVTREEIYKIPGLLAGESGTKVRLTVRRSGSDKAQDIELTRERFVHDWSTGVQLHALRAAINERLAQDPQNPGLLELRAELAGQWSDAKAQAADYTAAIDSLSRQAPQAATADLKRLYARRGLAHIASKQWRQAADDYARVITDTTADDDLLSNHALAQANSYLERESAAMWQVLRPTEIKSQGGATLTKLDDDSVLAAGVNPQKDTYTFVAETHLPKITRLQLEAMTHESLPRNGPGRVAWGNFALSGISLKAQPLSGTGRATTLKLFKPRADFEQDTCPVSASLLGEAGKGWAVDPKAGENHVALYEVESSELTGFEGGAKLTVTLDFQFNNQHALGHFRLAVSGEPATPDLELKRFAATKLTDPWQALAASNLLKGDPQAIDQLLSRRPSLAGRIGELFTQGLYKDWQRAADTYSRGIDAKNIDIDLLSKRACAHEELKNWDAAAADWSRVAIANPDGAKLLAQFARRLAAAGQVPLAKSQSEVSHGLYDQLLAKDPDNDIVATELAQLLLDEHGNARPAEWAILKPVEMKSKAGATLTLQSDGSILASGPNAVGDIYTVSAAVNLDRITAVRLEALPDPSLPHNGPGRHSSGNFQLSAIRLYQPASDGTKELRPLPVESAIASFGYKASDADIAGTIEEKLEKVWHVWGRFGEAHQATFFVPSAAGFARDRPLVIELRHKGVHGGINLGRFRLSVTADPTVDSQERHRSAAMQLTDPWSKLAAAYHLAGEQPAISKLLERHPAAAVAIGDLYAAEKDWERAIVEYRKVLTDRPADGALLTKLATAYESVGRTPEAVPLLAKASSADPKDTILSLKVAALQAWFGQDKEFAATRKRLLAFAKGTTDLTTADRAAKGCSLLGSTDKAELEAALALGREAVKLGDLGGWNLLALGMAEYRVGNDAAAEKALLAATAVASENNQSLTGISAFFRAMSLSRQGKADEARKVAIAAAVKMKPLPGDEQNPLARDASHDELILWLAWKEARTVLKIELSLIELLERARDDQKKTLGADAPSVLAITRKLADAYETSGRTPEAIPLLASASSADPNDTLLFLKVAALQAWFGQADQLAATRKRILASAKGTNDSSTAERAAKACSILPSMDKAELEAVLALGREAARLGNRGEWDLLALGMSEYRSGDYNAADKSLRAASEAGKDNRLVTSASAFYRAMSLSRLGKSDEARQLAISAWAKNKPLPGDEQNPLAGGATYDDLIVWMAYKEARALLQLDAAPPPGAENNKN
jgi:WD40 repeat protein